MNRGITTPTNTNTISSSSYSSGINSTPITGKISGEMVPYKQNPKQPFYQTEWQGLKDFGRTIISYPKEFLGERNFQNPFRGLEISTYNKPVAFGVSKMDVAKVVVPLGTAVVFPTFATGAFAFTGLRKEAQGIGMGGEGGLQATTALFTYGASKAISIGKIGGEIDQANLEALNAKQLRVTGINVKDKGGVNYLAISGEKVLNGGQAKYQVKMLQPIAETGEGRFGFGGGKGYEQIKYIPFSRMGRSEKAVTQIGKIQTGGFAVIPKDTSVGSSYAKGIRTLDESITPASGDAYILRGNTMQSIKFGGTTQEAGDKFFINSGRIEKARGYPSGFNIDTGRPTFKTTGLFQSEMKGVITQRQTGGFEIIKLPKTSTTKTISGIYGMGEQQVQVGDTSKVRSASMIFSQSILKETERTSPMFSSASTKTINAVPVSTISTFKTPSTISSTALTKQSGSFKLAPTEMITTSKTFQSFGGVQKAEVFTKQKQTPVFGFSSMIQPASKTTQTTGTTYSFNTPTPTITTQETTITTFNVPSFPTTQPIPFNPIIPIGPILPFRAFGSFDWGGGVRNVRGRKKSKYTPSYNALVFNIKGKAPKSSGKLALGTRPITKGFRWRFS